MFGLFSGKASASAEERFWQWFVENQAALHAMEQPNENLFDELARRLHAINPELTFEFSPVRGSGKKEFVVSAGGIKSAFPAVESTVASAPDLENWHWVKYRPRRSPLNNIRLGGKDVNIEDVRYVMGRDDKKVGIILFLPGYAEEEKNVFCQIGFLLLDEALGEYAVATQVGFIEFRAHGSKYFDQSSPITELAAHFDEFHGRDSVH